MALADLTHLLNRLVGERIVLNLEHDAALNPIRAKADLTLSVLSYAGEVRVGPRRMLAVGAASGIVAFVPEHHYHVYILASRTRRLYVGVTRNLMHRLQQHRVALPLLQPARLDAARAYLDRMVDEDIPPEMLDLLGKLG